ncbi:hypothetical protein C8F04DRAFT_1195154 [Mycena alexandri]|uniref:Uncharacterized protein n=1 Tax=Mycena alexandri TaxID=1745969 RepID=A0AAD6WQW6_9AGAR|nr:hypothetical protein C8F04DRAFT_1195154 [Mycena alexandri]
MSVLEAGARSPDSVAYYCRLKRRYRGVEAPPALHEWAKSIHRPDQGHISPFPLTPLLHLSARWCKPRSSRIQARTSPLYSRQWMLEKAMAKGARVDILSGDSELGATPQMPVALVFLTDPEEALCVSDNDGANCNAELPTVSAFSSSLDQYPPVSLPPGSLHSAFLPSAPASAPHSLCSRLAHPATRAISYYNGIVLVWEEI